jgi:hypothetical protein
VPRDMISAAMPATAIEPRMWTSVARVLEVRAGTGAEARARSRIARAAIAKSGGGIASAVGVGGGTTGATAGGASTFGGTVALGGGSGTVTVGRVTDGGGGRAARASPDPAQAPPAASATAMGRTTETECRGINPITQVGPRPVRRRMERDYYEVLGIQRDADPETIKHAYRARSRVLHPDVSGDPESEARFRELSEAYAVLSRPDARRLYDGLGWRGRDRGFERQPRAYHSNKRRLLQDLQSLIVATQGGRPEREPTRVVAILEVDAYEAHLGATRRVELGEEQRQVDVPVPPGTRDSDVVAVGTEEVAIVRIVPPRERMVVRTAALAGLVVALGFLLFLLAL